jgi:hypothetical protein
MTAVVYRECRRQPSVSYNTRPSAVATSTPRVVALARATLCSLFILQLVHQRTGESATRMILMGLNSIIDREVVYKDDTPNRGDFAICCENPCNRYRRS